MPLHIYLAATRISLLTYCMPRKGIKNHSYRIVLNIQQIIGFIENWKLGCPIKSPHFQTMSPQILPHGVFPASWVQIEMCPFICFVEWYLFDLMAVQFDMLIAGHCLMLPVLNFRMLKKRLTYWSKRLKCFERVPGNCVIIVFYEYFLPCAVPNTRIRAWAESYCSWSLLVLRIIVIIYLTHFSLYHCNLYIFKKSQS